MENALSEATRAWPELVRGVPKGLEFGLRNFWHPILLSSDLAAGTPVPVQCLNEELVAFRDASGAPRVLVDRCPHRSVRLSAGRVLEGALQCSFHGLQFDGDGRCTLIPWEEDGSEQRAKMCAKAYPTREIGGYVWSYLGDVARFPPPPIEQSLPEELLHPERYVHFVHATDIWEANWLLVVDGNDAYHAVSLHVDSQQHDAVLRYLEPSVRAQYQAVSSEKQNVPLAQRRVKIVETGDGLRGISIGPDGRHLDHGHQLGKVRGERFNLPGLVTNTIQAVANAVPYVSRLFQVPIDYRRTRMFRHAAWRAESPAERARFAEHFEKVVKPRQIKTALEDSMIAAAAGDLVESRASERLLGPDRDMIQVRRRLAAAYLAQQLEGRRVPESERTPTAESLVFPV